MSITFMNRTSRIAIAARSMLLATVIVLATSVSGRHPAKAYEAPWCAVISDGYWDCQYRSIEECGRMYWQAIVAGAIRARTTSPGP